MYNIPYFKAEEYQQVLSFMRQYSFVTLCGCDANNNPVATHVPILIEEREGRLFLLGHIMKQTDHHKALLYNNNVLAIFTGPHSYVSASWYGNKQQASTWNYMTVHAKGALSFLGDDALLEVLTRTTEKYEKNEQSPALVDKLAPEYVQRLMKAIVAFEVEVKEIDHVFKLSQNKDIESYNNLIAQLEKGDDSAVQVAHEMKKRIQK